MKSRHKKQQKSKKHFNNYILIALALALALGLIIYKSLLNPTPLQIAEIGSSTGTVTLKLESDKQTLTTGETAQVRLAYSAGNTHLTAVQTDLSFDTTLVELSSPSVDPSFPTAIISPKIENGKLSFALGTVVSDDSGITGNGNVLTFTLKALKPGTPTINFSANTLATTKEGTTNQLRSVENITLNLGMAPSPSTNTTVCAQVAGKCFNTAGECIGYSDGCQRTDRCALPIINCNTKPLKSSSPSPTASPLVASPSPSPSITASSTPTSLPSPTASPLLPLPASPTNSAAPIILNSPTNLKYNCYSNGTRITLRWDAVSNATSYNSTLTSASSNAKTATSTRPEVDLDIIGNTTYTWSLTSIQGTLSSSPITLKDISCNTNSGSTNPSTTPETVTTPAPTATPTPTPNSIVSSITNFFKKSPTPKPSAKPSTTAAPTPTPTLNSPSPTHTPGNLADIFASPTPNTTPTPSAQVNIITKIFLGWQALFIKIVESITR